MANFLAELKRRHLYRVAAAYAVMAWVLFQLVTNVAPVLDLPIWVARTFLLALIIGFPITLLFAWMRELAPADGTTPRAVTGKSDWVLAGGLAVIIALVSYQQFTQSADERAVPAQQAGVEAARAAAASVPAGVSIAVLPFTNLSSDAEQEFFSDGITEEITAALAKVPDLRVVARTSAFEFKGQNKDMQAIGQALRATHLIEGSVRKAGTRVRITAQLIKTDDGTHIWSENYDRELTDVFAIQEDVATAIAGALRMPLGLAPGARLVSNRSVDPESYQQYLRAKALVLSRGRRDSADSVNILESLVVRNPDYAPAWALLSSAYRRAPTTSREAVDSRREAAARRAIELDPNLADGYLALAGLEAGRGKLPLAEDLFSKALALDPNNPEGLNQYGTLLVRVGRLKESLAMRQQVRALEPFVPVYNGNLADILWLNGQDEAAIEIFKEFPERPTGGGTPRGRGEIARTYAAQGRYGEAADLLLELSSMKNVPVWAAFAKDGARLLRTAPSVAASPQDLPRLGLGYDAGFVYLYIGAPGRALEEYEELGEAGVFPTALLWHPSYAPVRKMERFKAYVHKAGFVDYWRAKGWPEFCHPTTGDDFACE